MYTRVGRIHTFRIPIVARSQLHLSTVFYRRRYIESCFDNLFGLFRLFIEASILLSSTDPIISTLALLRSEEGVLTLCGFHYTFCIPNPSRIRVPNAVIKLHSRGMVSRLLLLLIKKNNRFSYCSLLPCFQPT